MSLYRVGGWVRDTLLGYEPKDNDYVVVGETKESFVAKWVMGGYNVEEIGKSFPVYLVTRTDPKFPNDEFKGEFAFARRERKVAAGHGGFTVEADPSITLEDDLFRRDLTCNAIAVRHVHKNNIPLDSQVIDPFGGVSDIRAGILRHVSDAFVEDPLRVYRLARFAARFNWVIAPETYRLARTIPEEELRSLSAERVWGETERALRSAHPWRYFEELARLKALHVWMPELHALIGVPAGPPQHHGEGDSFTHTMMVLTQTLGMRSWMPDGDENLRIRFAALCHDLGKGVTPRDQWPSHHDHDKLGVPVVQAFCDRLRVPNDLRDCAVVACREHMRVHNFLDMKKGKWVDLVVSADRTKMKAGGLALVSMADSLGRLPSVESEGAKALIIAADAIRAEKGHPIPSGHKGKNIGLHIRNKKGVAARRALKEAGLK